MPNSDPDPTSVTADDLEFEVYHVIQSQTDTQILNEWYRFVENGHQMSVSQFAFVNRIFRELDQPVQIIHYLLLFAKYGYYLQLSDYQKIQLHYIYD